MKRKELISLSEKILNGEANELEIRKYNAWYNSFQQDDMPVVGDEKGDVLYAAIEKRISAQNKPAIKLWLRWTVAASIAVAIAFAGYFYTTYQQGHKSFYANDLAPGSNSAVLKLANGKAISLSNAQTGITINLAELTYTDGSKVAALSEKVTREDMEISTPLGGQYQVVLGDGTRVWLNAGSALKFPSDFTMLKKRKVELSGEAYFEVAKDQKRPFLVISAGQEVEVLGTHFNINNYEKEKNSKTTLLEGSVRITATAAGGTGNEARVLKINEQATLAAGGIRVKTVNTEEAMAWKNGYFDFNEEKLESIMEKIARWYNVTIIYQDPELKEQTFTGNISKFRQASEVLNKIALSEVVHFRIEGRNIIVMK